MDTPLKTLGKFTATFESKHKVTVDDIHVISGNAGCLLSYKTASDLMLIALHINTVEKLPAPHDQIRDIPGAINISDDVIIYGKTPEEHNNALKAVIEKFIKVGLTLNREKCLFAQKSLTFFRFVFSEKGVSADPEKVKSIHNAPAPQSAGKVRSFLGMATYCAKFIPHFSDLTHSLRELTKKNTPFRWSDKQQQEFDALKKAFHTKIDPQKETEVITDASHLTTENTSETHQHLVHRDFIEKGKMKENTDRAQRAKASGIDIGDTVLVKQPKQNKLSTNFNPDPYIVIEKKGKMLTAYNEGKDHTITRNISHFKRFPIQKETEIDSDIDDEDIMDMPNRPNVQAEFQNIIAEVRKSNQSSSNEDDVAVIDEESAYQNGITSIFQESSSSKFAATTTTTAITKFGETYYLVLKSLLKYIPCTQVETETLQGVGPVEVSEDFKYIKRHLLPEIRSALDNNVILQEEEIKENPGKAEQVDRPPRKPKNMSYWKMPTFMVMRMSCQLKSFRLLSVSRERAFPEQLKMEELEKRKKTRKYHRGVATKLLNKIHVESDKEPDDIDLRRLRLFETDLKEKATVLMRKYLMRKSPDEEIFALTIEHGDEGTCGREAEKSSEYNEKDAYNILTLEERKLCAFLKTITSLNDKINGIERISEFQQKCIERKFEPFGHRKWTTLHVSAKSETALT
eukprot:gene3861-15158_t